MIRRRSILLTLLACSTPAFGQVPDSTNRPPVFRVGEISVQAARPVTTAGGASALEVQLDSLVLAPAPTLEQVLRELPLVQVRTNSRGEVQFSLRGSGSDARQVAVLIDGVPLNLGWDDRADLSVLPATAAGTLTLIRGLPSMLHGPNVLGGVIEVGVGHHPGRWMPARQTDVSAGVESTGAYSLAAAHGEPLSLGTARLAVRAGAGFRDRPGFALPADVVQVRAAEGDLRANTDLRHGDGFVALRYLAAGGGWATFSSSGFTAERGIAAELHAERPRFWRYPAVARLLGVLSAGTGDRASPFGGRGDIEASVGYDAGRTDIVSYTDAGYSDIDAREEGDDRTITLRLMGDQSVGAAGELRLALTYADISHDERITDSTPRAYRQRVWSIGGETAWGVPLTAALPHLRLSVAGALDGADTPETGGAPALGRLTEWGARLGATTASASGTLLLHAGVSRRARFPSLRELYSGALGRFLPNPALQAEVLTAAESGITTRLGARGELQVVGFYRDLDRGVERITLANGMQQRVNVGAVRSAGIELLGSVQYGRVALGADVTVQRVRLLDDGAGNGSRHPEYQPSLIAGASARVDLPAALRAGATFDYVGRQYCIDPNAPGELELAASRRIDLDVARSVRVRTSGFGSRIELSAALDNVTDAAVYDQCGLPQPGRTLRVQLRLR